MNTGSLFRLSFPHAFAAALLLGSLSLPAAPRPWTTPQGAVTADYISATADTVTLRTANGQALRLKLSDLAEADRAFVAQKQAEAKEANMIDATLKGEIVWRLPNWNSISWSTTHDTEIWLWDDKTRTPTEKVAGAKAEYRTNTSTRNQFEGTYSTKEKVHIAKDARVVVKAKFSATVNGKQKEMEELSVPITLPALNKGEIKLPTVRLSLTKG